MTTFSSLIDEIQDTRVSQLTKKQLRALTRITDLFIAGSGRHSKQQIELFDEVFETLVAVIELETRVKLARHIATMPHAPAALVRAFAFDDADQVGRLHAHGHTIGHDDNAVVRFVLRIENQSSFAVAAPDGSNLSHGSQEPPAMLRIAEQRGETSA